MVEDHATSAEAIEQLVRDIIDRGSAYDVQALDEMYDDALQVIRVTVDGVVRVTGKADTLRFFRTMREGGSPPLSQAARIRVTEVGDDRAHAVVLREMQVTGMPRRLVFSVECVRRGGRWRVIREVAVAQS